MRPVPRVAPISTICSVTAGSDSTITRSTYCRSCAPNRSDSCGASANTSAAIAIDAPPASSTDSATAARARSCSPRARCTAT